SGLRRSRPRAPITSGGALRIRAPPPAGGGGLPRQNPPRGGRAPPPPPPRPPGGAPPPASAPARQRRGAEAGEEDSLKAPRWTAGGNITAPGSQTISPSRWP